MLLPHHTRLDLKYCMMQSAHLTHGQITLTAALLLVLLCFSPSAMADEIPAATPYRPAVSNPAELSTSGWLDVEAGFSSAGENAGTWQNNTPWLLKLAFTDDFGITMSGDAQVRQNDMNGSVLCGDKVNSLLLNQI
jgi:hypothetical protein